MPPGSILLTAFGIIEAAYYKCLLKELFPPAVVVISHVPLEERKIFTND